MTREDTIKVLSVLRGAYPAFYRDITKQEAESTITLWMSMFEEESYELVGTAVKAFISGDGKGFPPAIGQIKELIRQITQPEEMTAFEAWTYVANALRNSTYGSVEEFAKLPPLIQRVVGSPEQLKEWAVMEADVVQSVISSNFQRSFKVRQERDRDFEKLPSEVKAFIGQIAGTTIGRLEGGHEEIP